MKSIKYILIFFFLIGIISCQDFLEQEPGSQTSIKEQLSTYEGVLQALNGCYLQLEELHTNGIYTVYADILGGNIAFSPTPSGTYKGQVNVPYTVEKFYSFADNAEQSDFRGFYDGCYQLINSANLILEYADLLIDATEPQIEEVKAEALTIKAYTHFMLVRIYAQNYSFTSDASHKGIVYNTSTVKVTGQYSGRISVKDTYNHIITDLELAIDLFSDANVQTGAPYSYFNQNAAKALLARVALQANDWQKAAHYSNQLIENNQYQLLTKENYITSWEMPNLPVNEIIMELSARMTADGDISPSNTVAAYFGYVTESNFGDYTASGDLLDIYSDTDIRGKQMFVEVPIPTLIGEELSNVSYFFTRKFQDNPGYPLIRLSEMYLIHAEANARLNKLDDALNSLNIIRLRAGLTELVSNENILDEIFIERRRELCFEGHLFFDIVRFHKDIERNKGCNAILCNVAYPSDFFVLPIPKDNIDLNSNLEQNEGY